MRPYCPRSYLALAAALALPLALGCSRKTANPLAAPSATQAVATLAPSTPSASLTVTATGSVTPTATAGATPVAGASIKVGDATVVIDRFRATISAPQGVNIRSSPEVTATNRTGSLAPGATVDVEGRAQGQEAEQGNGTNWFYVGTVGDMPQFIYGPTGTLTPLTGSATPGAATPGASATPPASATP